MEQCTTRSHRAGFAIAAVSIDEEAGRRAGTSDSELGLSFDLLQDRSGHVQQLYQTTGVPESFLLDRHGVIVKRIIGAHDWNSPANRALVDGSSTSPAPDVSLRAALTADLPLKLTSARPVGLPLVPGRERGAREHARAGGPHGAAPRGRTVVRTGGPVRALVSGPRRELLKLSATPMRLDAGRSPTPPPRIRSRSTSGPATSSCPRGVDVHVQDVQPRAVAVDLDSTFQRVVPVRAVVRLQPERGSRAERDRGRAGHRAPARPARGNPAHRLRAHRAARGEPRPMARSRRRWRWTRRASGACGRCRPQVTVRVSIEAIGERTLTRRARAPAERPGGRRPAGARDRERAGARAPPRGLPRSPRQRARGRGLGRTARARHAPRFACWRPPGLDARALPDSIALVRRSGDG